MLSLPVHVMLVMATSLQPLILSLVSSQIHLASCLGVPVFDPSVHCSVILEEFAEEVYFEDRTNTTITIQFGIFVERVSPCN